MQHRTIAAIAAASLCVHAAHAAFLGWSVDTIDLGNGHRAVNVFVDFSHSQDRLLNVYRGHITTTAAGGFYQSSLNPAWQPSGQSATDSDDSWVTIDLLDGNGMACSVTPDPNFANFDDASGATDFSVVQSIGNGAGWYNPNPASTFGLADGGRVMVAHLVVADFGQGFDISWNMTLAMNTPQGDTIVDLGVGTHLWTFPSAVPGPGAAPLAALALAFRRRGRR